MAKLGRYVALTMAVVRGQKKFAPQEPRVWFPSTESFAKVLSAGNRELLRMIAEKAPGSLEELAALSGRKKSNLSPSSGWWLGSFLGPCTTNGKQNRQWPRNFGPAGRSSIGS